MSSPALPPKPSIHSPDNMNAEHDPFLAQSSSISLTARDRQEGYDVDLLNSAPRVSGRSSAAPIPSSLGEKSYGTAPTSVPVRERDHLIAERASSEDNLRELHKKPWYLRPLALLVLGAIVLIVALGLGLGFGLGLKHDSAQDAAKAASESFSYVPPISTATQTGSPIVNTLASGQQRASPVSNRTVTAFTAASTATGVSIVALSASVSPTLVASASIFNFNASSAIPSGARNTPVPVSELLTRTLTMPVETPVRRRR